MGRQNIRFGRFLVLIVSTILLVVLNTGNVQTQSNQRCFAETGHCISGRIQEFWTKNGGAEVFGYPLGAVQEEFVEGEKVKVQWFERSRLELHPENPRPKDVLVGRLGIERLEMLERDIDISSSVGQQFLDYWKNNGIELDGISGTSEKESLALFGNPISGAKTEEIDGKSYTVQWFERARLQYLSDNQPPKIILGDLGAELFPLMTATYTPPDPGTGSNPGSGNIPDSTPGNFLPASPPQITLIPNEKPKEPARAALKITNNNDDTIRFTLLGPTKKTLPLAGEQTLKLDIDPGTYQSRIAAKCEVKTESFTIQVGQVKEVDIPKCVKVKTGKAIINITNQNNDRARFILKGPTSNNWFVRAGQTLQLEVIPGQYQRTVANSCGSNSENVTITENETLAITIKECGRSRIKVINNNDVDIKLELRGPTSGNWSVRSGQIFDQEIFSGDYQITTATVCGSKIDNYTIDKGFELRLAPECEPPVIALTNEGDGVVRVTLSGPTSNTWSVPKGETIEKKVAPGDYEITTSSACPPKTESFTIASGQRREFTLVD